MKRLALFLVTAAALAVTGGAARANPPGYGPWETTFQGPITAPTGLVCPFAVSAEPVVEHLRVRYHTDAAGNVDGYEATGALVARITNLESGVSVQRNLSGPGTVVFHPDGSYDAVTDGNFLVFFLPGDSPSSRLLLTSGHSVLHGNPDGTKTLVSSTGRSENLCDTLA